MKIGKYDVHVLTFGHFRMDGGGLFGIIPKKLWLRSYPHVDEDNRVLMAAKALLVIGDGVVLVADSGLGEKLDAKTQGIFCVDQPHNAIGAALRVHGITPSQVTHYVYTHLHFDHAGGSTCLRDGVLAPTFPNAQHFVQRDHLAWARSPSDKDRASFTPANWEPVADAGLLQEIDGQLELLPGIELQPIHGHTPAMQMVAVKDASGGFVYTIDLFPTAAHIPPHYVAAFDNYPLLAMEEKREFLAASCKNNVVVGFGHDPECDGVLVEQNAKGFAIREKLKSI